MNLHILSSIQLPDNHRLIQEGEIIKPGDKFLISKNNWRERKLAVGQKFRHNWSITVRDSNK